MSPAGPSMLPGASKLHTCRALWRGQAHGLTRAHTHGRTCSCAHTWPHITHVLHTRPFDTHTYGHTYALLPQEGGRWPSCPSRRLRSRGQHRVPLSACTEPDQFVQFSWGSPCDCERPHLLGLCRHPLQLSAPLPCQDTLTEVSDWLEQHPREVVILACRNFEGMTEGLHEYLVTCIQNIFGDMLCPRGVRRALTHTCPWQGGGQGCSHRHLLARSHPA